MSQLSRPTSGTQMYRPGAPAAQTSAPQQVKSREPSAVVRVLMFEHPTKLKVAQQATMALLVNRLPNAQGQSALSNLLTRTRRVQSMKSSRIAAGLKDAQKNKPLNAVQKKALREYKSWIEEALGLSQGPAAAASSAKMITSAKAVIASTPRRVELEKLVVTKKVAAAAAAGRVANAPTPEAKQAAEADYLSNQAQAAQIEAAIEMEEALDPSAPSSSGMGWALPAAGAALAGLALWYVASSQKD